MGRIFGKIKQKIQKLPGKMDQSQKAITFAEAGQAALVQEKLQTELESEVVRKLVVVGRESVFSEDIIDYALEMAERMSYEIVALNTAPLSCETFNFFSSSRKKICEDFKGLSKKNVRMFQEAAKKKEIPFTHVVKFSESYEGLKEIRNEIGGFEFVVSESEDQAAVSRPENGERAKSEIFVYSMM
ncbi:MAG: hypothetical protein QF466_04615 [Desulfobacterales bacterium]|nr:hypothetical protein [Desulfobacter sp.]MDP6394720.1 hypothetical protein [Desulfobacterales bacterium]MDP6681582.1 hypothetical protein [Desulfobacterales bacterium]MDP6806796.1 hypothetical protein [Desulfobacterales bacterium]